MNKKELFQNMKYRPFLLLGLLSIILLFLLKIVFGYSGDFSASLIVFSPVLIGLDIVFQAYSQKKKVFLMIVTFSFALVSCLFAMHLYFLDYEIRLWLLMFGVYSNFIPILLLGSVVLNMVQGKFDLKLKTEKPNELEKEDAVLSRSVAFIQSTFFILNGLQFLAFEYWFIIGFIITNLLFFSFRGYASIRDSNLNRYRSTLLLIVIPIFDVLMLFRTYIQANFPLFYDELIVPIPVSLNIIYVTLIFAGLLIILLRKMLLIRYELPEDTLF